MELFIVFVLGAFATWQYMKYIVRKAKKNRIKGAPVQILPILASPESFDLSHYTEITLALPSTSDTWWESIWNSSEDKSKLESYAYSIDKHRQNVEIAAFSAISKFENDHAHLVDQQLQIYRRVYQSRELLKRFKELKGNKVSGTDIPDSYRVTVPPKPNYPTLEQIGRKYSLDTSHIGKATGQAVGKALTNTGGIKNPNNIAVAVGVIAVTTAITVVRGAANVSKMKRVLEDTKGKISNYSISLKTTVGILGNTHVQLVGVSNNLKNVETRIIDLVSKIGEISKETTKLEQLTPDLRKDIYVLHCLTLEAESYSKNSL